MRAAASLLFALGSSLREIQETLGHAEVALTANTYTHVAAGGSAPPPTASVPSCAASRARKAPSEGPSA